MTVGTSMFRSPLGLLALGLVLAGLAGLVRRGAAPPPGPTAGCAADDPACLPTDRAAPLSSAGPVVVAEEVCSDVGYLCSEVEETGRFQVRRWKGFQGTLVVHVPEPPHEDRTVALGLQRAAAAGIRAWNGQPFPILVDERGTRQAHVQVEWTRSLGGTSIGRAEVRWSAGTGLEVRRLVLATRSPFRLDRSIDRAQVRLTAAHEMGHALGLPHSDAPRDVMYPKNTAASLTTRDYRTLEALYALDDGTVIARR